MASTRPGRSSGRRPHARMEAPRTGTGRSLVWPPLGKVRSASGRSEGPSVPGFNPGMTHGREKSDSSIVPKKPPNKAGRPAAEAVEGRGEAPFDKLRRERGPAKHAPDAEPGTRVTGAGTRTRSRKAGWHTTVHRASPPCEHRSSPGAVPGTEARRGARRRRCDMGGLRQGPGEQSRGPARPYPPRSVSGAAEPPAVYPQAALRQAQEDG